MMVKFNLLQH